MGAHSYAEDNPLGRWVSILTDPHRLKSIALYACFVGILMVMFLFWMFVLFWGIVLCPVEPEIRVGSATVSQLQVSSASAGSQLTAIWDITLVAINPNNINKKNYMPIAFLDSLQATIFYRDFDYASQWDNYNKVNVMLATKSLPPPPPLDNNNNNRALISFKLEAEAAYVGDDMASQISQGMKSRSRSRARGGLVRFDINLLCWFRYLGKGSAIDRFMGNLSQPTLYRTSCELEFRFSPPRPGIISNNNGTTGTVTITDGQSLACHAGAAIYKGIP